MTKNDQKWLKRTRLYPAEHVMLRGIQSGQITDTTGARDSQKCVVRFARNAISLPKAPSFRPTWLPWLPMADGCHFGRKEEKKKIRSGRDQ